MDINHIRLQYERLTRHYLAALETKDEISFLDLAHALRIWVDLKDQVTQLAKELGAQLPFAHYTQPKIFKRSLQGSRYVYIQLASGVESSGVQVKGGLATNRASKPEEIAKRVAIGRPIARAATNMTYAEWLAVGVIVAPSNDPKHPHLPISREIMIKRVANTLGASHPAGMDNNDLQEKKFDPYIKELHTIRLADGYPATYYQLLEIASVLLQGIRPLCDSVS